ncbi:type I-E CRISPR-associated protein Cse1/CasA [Methylolobus aquaticus]|nr:type I-E CRISPR-associated protein Cse1/CasA [Methylolobus aquaticus]
MTTDADAPAFNLLDEPWIPVRNLAGEVVPVSLTKALLNARAYVAIAETSPPNLIALYRVLLATLHRALTTHHGPWKDADRARWFREGLPETPIRAYLEQWRERFWLFHPTHPFMQVAELTDAPETREDKALRPWTQLTLDHVSGNAPAVFDHSIDDAPTRISYAEGIRSLLGYLQFVPGGMVRRFRFRDESGPLDNASAILPIGKTLAQTLCLALHSWSRDASNDLPPWEINPPSAPDLRGARATLPTGQVDACTRLTRAALLVADGEKGSIGVSYVRFGAGLTLESHDPGFPDEMVAYRRRGETKISPITFQDGRALWRDLPALLPSSELAYHAPAVISHALNCLEHVDVDQAMSFMAAGTASDPVQCKVFRWRIEQIQLPCSLVTNPDSVAELRGHVSMAEEFVFKKGGLSSLLAQFVAESLPDSGNADTRERARDIRDRSPFATVYFLNAERALPKLMQQLAAGEIEAADREWKTALEKGARDAWETVRRSLGDSPAALRAEAKTYPRFIGLLKSLTPPIDEPMTEEVNP